MMRISFFVIFQDVVETRIVHFSKKKKTLCTRCKRIAKIVFGPVTEDLRRDFTL